MALQRNIKPMALLFMSISGIVGSGWLFGPFYASQLAGPASVLSWIIGFVIIFVIALPFAELSSRYPVAGGVVHFSRMSHGLPLSLLVSFANWIAFVTIAPIEVQATLQYTSHFFPALIHIENGAKALSYEGLFFATVLMLMFTIINLFGIKFAAKMNSFVALWKMVVPIILLVMLFVFRFKASNFTQGSFMPSGFKGVFAAVSTGGVVFSFIGFRHAVELGAEARNPQKAIPMALLGSLVFCVILYVLLQVTFIGALLPKNFIQGWHHLNFHHHGGPLLNVVISVGIVWLIVMIYVDSIISPFGAGMISSTSTARVIYAMSKNHYLPQFFQKINRFGVPSTALWLNFVIGMLFFLPFQGWQKMISIMVDTALIAYTVGAVSVLSLRRYGLHMQQSKTFRMPGGKFTAWLAFYFGTLVLYWSGWGTIWHLGAAMLIGVAMMLFVAYKHKAKAVGEWRAVAWFIFYMLGVMVISFLGSYGGNHDITIGWDFVVIALFSLLVYAVAVYTRLPEAYLAHVDVEQMAGTL